MWIDGVSDAAATLAGDNFSVDSTRRSKTTLDKDDFLKLYIEQLKNQDPTNPMDTNAMAAQMSQYSTVEQLMNIGKSIDGMASQQMGMAVNYIGHQVTYLNDDQIRQTGIVQAVDYESDCITLAMSDGSRVNLDHVVSVTWPDVE